MDITNYIKILDESANDTLQLANSCPPSRLTVSVNEKWSVLQILEHIYMTEKLVYTLLSKPSDKTAETIELLGNDKIKKLVVEKRGQKVSAPAFLYPMGEIKDLKEFEKVFTDQRNTLKQDIQSGKIIVDNRIHKHPLLGEMTIADWLNFMIHHTQRHLEQIKDLP